MARVAKVIDLPSLVKLNKADGQISAQLIQILRDAVQHGDLHAGDHLPSSRELAQTLGIARGTIIEAYDQLIAEGVLEARARQGTFVSHTLFSSKIKKRSEVALHKASVNPLTSSAQAYTKILKEFKPLPHRPFAISVPTGRTQPSDVWRKFGNRFRARGVAAPSGYDDPQGVYALRSVIADYVRRSRSVQCEPEQIVITSGIQQALYICSQILFNPQDSVWVEDPAYRGTTAILENSLHHLQITRVPVDDEGIQVQIGNELSPGARAAFVTPSHQYPLGMPMSLARRTALVDWAAHQHAWIIEDDYDSELRYTGHPFPALQGLAPDQVIYLGTFSKVLFPSLRMGYAILPKVLVAPFCGLRVLIDRHPPSADQHVLAAFIQEGYLERHIRRIRNVYAENRKLIIQLIEHYIPKQHAFIEVGDQGMHMVLWFAEALDDLKIAQSALEAGVSVKAVSSTFSIPAKRSGLILGLGDFDTIQIENAIKLLAKIILENI